MLVNIPNIPAPQREPDPQPSAITRALCAELIRREQVGTLKYGKPLEPHDGRRTLVDVREELLDACVYITKCIMEQEWQPIESAPKDANFILVWMPECECTANVFWDGYEWALPSDDPLSDYYLGSPTHWKPLPPPPHIGSILTCQRKQEQTKNEKEW